MVLTTYTKFVFIIHYDTWRYVAPSIHEQILNVLHKAYVRKATHRLPMGLN